MKSITEIKMRIRLLGLSSITIGVFFAINSAFQLAALSDIIEAKMEATEGPRYHGSFDYTEFKSSYIEILWKPAFFFIIGYLAFSATNLINKTISSDGEFKTLLKDASEPRGGYPDGSGQRLTARQSYTFCENKT
jgi:hypothetical protein